MAQQNQFAEENLIGVIRSDCLRQAQMAQAKLNEVVECLGDENHLGALGSFAGLDEDIACLRVCLTRIARRGGDSESISGPASARSPERRKTQPCKES